MEKIDFTNGGVYFLKHIGQNAIKVSTYEGKSPKKEFTLACQFSPNGSVLIGFIPSAEKEVLKQRIENYLATKSIVNGWFNITQDEAEKCIEIYSTQEAERLRNQFNLLFCDWMESENKKGGSGSLSNSMDFKIQRLKEIYLEDKNFNRTKVSELLGVSRQTILNWIKNFD